MTVEQAIKEGYTHCIYEEDGWQPLMKIKGEGVINWKRHVVLVSKEPAHPMGISAKEIGEILAEHIELNHYDNTGDDTGKVERAIVGLDFSDIERRIKECLSKINIYQSTDIELTK